MENLIFENWRRFLKESSYETLNEQERFLIEEGMIQNALNWTKEKGKAGLQGIKEFFRKFKQEMSETKEGIKLLVKMVKGVKLTDEEINFIKEQAKDIALGSILLGIVALPGGGIAVAVLVKLAKKFGIDLMPSSFKDQKAQ
tara:strand:- start:68 stop:493 length:426 start_codon:yes stop_codon:yes gene_type:complete